MVKLKGAALASAKIVEAPSEGGLHVEAQIPWSAFPDAAKVRVGLRAAVTYTDADGSGSISGVISTASGRSGKALPPLLLEAEEGLESQLLKPKGLSNASREAFGNVSGDAMYERVAVFGDSLAIVGPHYRGRQGVLLRGSGRQRREHGHSARAGRLRWRRSRRDRDSKSASARPTSTARS